VLSAAPSEEGVQHVHRALLSITGGLGADHVFMTVGGDSNDPAKVAARLARDRARIIDIGKCRLDLPWNQYYEKELDVRFSRSYGPGRYDDRYELEGVDYPPAYVRWTERRNMACFLDLVARAELSLDPLVSAVFPIDEAADVYRRLKEGELPGVGFLFEYPRSALATTGARARPSMSAPHASRSAACKPAVAGVRLGFIGAGNYASSMLLPHLAGRKDVALVHVVTTTSLSAANAVRRFGFADCSTDPCSVLDDASIDAVFIVTRHSSHAEFAARALERGKAVFVEKPLALSTEELERVLQVVADTGNDRLMVGFNRRFAPLLVDLRRRFHQLSEEPAVLRYLINAGKVDPRSWYRDAALEGSRFAGEGGHFVDTVSWWLDASPIEVHAFSGRDPEDVLVSLRLTDGSVASILYTTGGNPRFPKETFEVIAGGRVARLDNFQRATIWSGRRRLMRRSRFVVDKGQRQQMEQFLLAVRCGAPMPISLASISATTRATLGVTRSLISGRPEAV
jgi:predicted dehydrogenase